MSAKLRVHGRPQVNTRKKRHRFMEALKVERAIDARPLGFNTGQRRTPRLHYRWHEHEQKVQAMLEGVRGA